MKTSVLTGHNGKFAALSEITSPLMEHYAKQHGFGFTNTRYGISENPYWGKVGDTLALLKDPHWGRVLWLDIDQLITTPEVSFDRLTSGVHFSQDWGVDATDYRSFSACGFVACQDAIPLFQWLLSVKKEYENGPFPEQTPLRLAYAENRFPDLMHVHARRVFNAVPIEVHPTVVEPWQPGDFSAHLTMLPVEERVALAKKIIERNG